MILKFLYYTIHNLKDMLLVYVASGYRYGQISEVNMDAGITSLGIH